MFEVTDCYHLLILVWALFFEELVFQTYGLCELLTKQMTRVLFQQILPKIHIFNIKFWRLFLFTIVIFLKIE